LFPILIASIRIAIFADHKFQTALRYRKRRKK
jgi:hypothetical protein